MKKIKKLLSAYENWALSLDDLTGLVAIVVPIAILVFVIFFSIARVLDRHAKNECLDSLLPRRYYGLICEERVGDEWIKVNPSNEKVYYYNESASK